MALEKDLEKKLRITPAFFSLPTHLHISAFVPLPVLAVDKAPADLLPIFAASPAYETQQRGCNQYNQTNEIKYISCEMKPCSVIYHILSMPLNFNPKFFSTNCKNVHN